jgi:hypothetical protein
MYRAFRWAGPVALLAAFVAARADDPKPPGDPPKAKADDEAKSPADQLKALQKEYTDAMQAFYKAYSQAKTDEERQKVFGEKYPKPQTFASKFLKLADDNPKDPAAVDALVWVCQNVRGGDDHQKAIDILLKDHFSSTKLGDVALVMGNSSGDKESLRKLMKDSPHRDVQGKAAYALAQALKGRGKGELPKEVEELYEMIADKYADVKIYGNRKLGDMAKGELYEVRFLAVGKTAPDIEGEDIDAAKFKLSDYRGKVVMLDFWGNW